MGDPKHTRLEALTAEMLGDIGALHDAVGQLTNDLAGYDVRAGKLYDQLLDVNALIQHSTEQVKAAAGQGVEELQDRVRAIATQTVKVMEALQVAQGTVAGENGIAAHAERLGRSFDDKVLRLDRGIEALTQIQASPLVTHEKAIDAIKTMVVAALAFCAGSALTPSAWLLPIGLGVFAAGVGAGVLMRRRSTNV